jgi:AAA+ superfamily predicted ATPase
MAKPLMFGQHFLKFPSHLHTVYWSIQCVFCDASWATPAFALAGTASVPHLARMSQRMISDVIAKPDAALEMTLRPSLFSDFTGQPKVKERLEITVEAARQRNEALDHILLSGPPGLGKTTLANILAKAMGGNLKSTSGPTIHSNSPQLVFML